MNIRSVKNNDMWLKQELVEQDIDLSVVTETWLRNSDEQWIEGTELNKDGFEMQNTSRQDGRIGGGIALVYRDVYNIKKIEERHLRTFQSTKWKLTLKNTHLSILGVYRPPPLKSHITTVNQLTDEFLENLQEDIINSDNLIILGDFNIHISDTIDADAQ